MPGKQNASVSDAEDGKMLFTKLDPSVACNENSKYIRIPATYLRFLFCGENNDWTSKKRLKPVFFSQENISRKSYLTVCTEGQWEDFGCDRRVWRGWVKMGKEGWLTLHKKQVLLSRSKTSEIVTD